MDCDFIIFGTLFFLLPILFLVVSFFLSIPKSLESLQKLTHSHKAADFRDVVFWISLSFFFLSAVLVTWLRLSLHYEPHISQFLRFIIGIGFIYLTFYFFIPKTYHFFQRWKTSKNPTYFSKTILFGFASLFFLSLLYLRMILSATGINHA